MRRTVVIEYEDKMLHPSEVDDIARRHSRTITLKSYEQFAEVKAMADDIHRLLGHIYAIYASWNKQPTASQKGWDLAATEAIKAKAIAEDHTRIVRDLAALPDEVEVHTGDEVRVYWPKDGVLEAVHNL